MWTCPKCRREFEKINQNHSCGSKPATIDEYITMQSDEAVKLRLQEIRNTIREAIPEAYECISWSMPTWKRKNNIIHMAAAKCHIGIFPGPDAIIHFAKELETFNTSKGTIRLPNDKPLPLELIRSIAAWCYNQEIRTTDN